MVELDKDMRHNISKKEKKGWALEDQNQFDQRVNQHVNFEIVLASRFMMLLFPSVEVLLFSVMLAV